MSKNAKEGGGGQVPLERSLSMSTIINTKPPVSSDKKRKIGTIKTSQSASNLVAGTSTSQTIVAVENGGGASASSTQIPVAPYCIGTYNMSWANEFLPLQKLFKRDNNVTIAEIKSFVDLYKYSSERTFLAQNDIVENTIQQIEDILNSSDQDEIKKQKIHNLISNNVISTKYGSTYKMFKYWEKTIDHLYSFFINKSPSAVGLQEINKDSTAIKEMLGKVNAYKEQYSKTKYIEIKMSQKKEPFVALSIIIDENVFGNMIKQDIYETDPPGGGDTSRKGGRPLLIVLTQKDDKYFLFANVHGKNIPPTGNAAMIEQSVTNKVIYNMNKFIGGLTQEEKTGIQEIFVMGDFNDKFDNIKNMTFDINGTPKKVSFNGDAPKSCCHNWDSSCSEEIKNKRKFNNTTGKCVEPTRTGTQVFESNKLYSDDKKTTVVPMTGHGNSIKDYKYAGDKVFGLNPWTYNDDNNIYDNTLKIFNPNDRTLSFESDHELVYGYFQRGDATKTYDKKLFIIGGPIGVGSMSSFREFKKDGADVNLFATFGNHSNATFQGDYKNKSFWTDTQTKIKDTIYGIAFDVGSGSWFTPQKGWFENVTELITTVLKDYGILVLDKDDSREFITYLNDNKTNISLKFKGYVGKYLVYAKQNFDLSQGGTIPFFSTKNANDYDETIAKYLQMYGEFLETTPMGERIVSTYSSTINQPPPPPPLVGPSSIKTPVSTSSASSNLPPPPPVKTPAELFIKVYFDGTIPTKVEIVSAIPAGESALDLQDYINNNLFGNTPPSGILTQYFKLTEDDQKLMKEMIA